MPNSIEVRDYFRSLIHPDERVKVCHRCGRLLNYEGIHKNGKHLLKRLKMPLNSFKWHKFKLCEDCFEDKQNHKICRKVDLEHLEVFNLTHNYIHKKI